MITGARVVAMDAIPIFAIATTAGLHALRPLVRVVGKAAFVRSETLGCVGVIQHVHGDGDLDKGLVERIIGS